MLAALMQGKGFALIAETFAMITADTDYHLQLPTLDRTNPEVIISWRAHHKHTLIYSG